MREQSLSRQECKCTHCTLMKANREVAAGDFVTWDRWMVGDMVEERLLTLSGIEMSRSYHKDYLKQGAI